MNIAHYESVDRFNPTVRISSLGCPEHVNRHPSTGIEINTGPLARAISPIARIILALLADPKILFIWVWSVEG